MFCCVGGGPERECDDDDDARSACLKNTLARAFLFLSRDRSAQKPTFSVSFNPLCFRPPANAPLRPLPTRARARADVRRVRRRARRCRPTRRRRRGRRGSAGCCAGGGELSVEWGGGIDGEQERAREGRNARARPIDVWFHTPCFAHALAPPPPTLPHLQTTLSDSTPRGRRRRHQGRVRGRVGSAGARARRGAARADRVEQGESGGVGSVCARVCV